MADAQDDELWLGPPWLLVIGTLIGFTGAMWSLYQLVPGAGIGLQWVPVLPIGAVALYAVLVRLVSGDPRLWRDPARLERLVRRQRPDWIGRHSDDPALAARLHALAWRSGAPAIAQQVGLVAGAAAGYATLGQGATVTVALVTTVAVAAGLLTRWLLTAAERKRPS